MIYLLILTTLIFLILNFLLAKKDYMHPAVIFHGMFLLYELMCLLGEEAYAVTLHVGSLSVISLGFCAMTTANLISHDVGKRKELCISELKAIKVPRIYLIALIIMQVVSILYFCKYLGNLSTAYYGTSDSTMSESIELYDTLTKFLRDEYNELAVPIPMAYRITNPLCAGAEYIVLYIMVNNFLVKKKVDPLMIMILGLMCIRIIMNGSRSPLLRIFTFIFLLLYVLSMKSGRIRRGDMKFFRKLIIAAFGFVALMFMVLIIMGRTTRFTGIVDHLFVYFGAPIVNLDTFIESYRVKLLAPLERGALIGAQTFKNLYFYLYKLFKIRGFSDIEEIELFAFSSNNREIGNVYTMFYKIIYDFGFLGVVPLTLIMGIYYCETYRKIMSEKSDKIIDLRLLIYAYLFNDIVMSAFSNRFYETIFDAPFIKFIIVVILLDIFPVEMRFRHEKTRSK